MRAAAGQTRTHFRVSEISRETGIPRSSLYDACTRGEIQAIRLGKSLFIPRVEAERLLGPVARDGGEEAE